MQKSPGGSEAPATFLARETETDAILAPLAALGAGHFNRAPDNVSWGHVGIWPAIWKDCARSATPLSTKANTWLER